MDANQVKSILSDQDIFELLEEVGAEPRYEGSTIVSRTRCHNPAHEGKHKLVYYSESKTFHCYTGCGSMDIFGLVGKIFELDFYNSFKYICMKYGISTKNEGFQSEHIDTSYFEKFKKKIDEIELPILDEKLLDTYHNIHHQIWLDDGISSRTMSKYGIKFSILNDQIIIPHRDENGDLVGIRARNLNKEIVDEGKKYMPVYLNGKVMKHPTGACLYGLDKNREKIEKINKVVLFESEKSVLQLDTMLPENSIGVCVSGSSLTNYQLELLKSLEIDEVIVAMDKEFEEIGDSEEVYYAKKISEVFGNRLKPYFRVSVLWDTNNLLEKKDSPTDKGLKIFQELYKNRIYI